MMKIHSLSFPTFGLTHSVRDFMDPQHLVVSYVLTRCLHSLNQKISFSCSPFWCCKECGVVFMVGSLPSGSLHSLQRHPQWCNLKFSQWACWGASPIMLDYHLWPDIVLFILYSLWLKYDGAYDTPSTSEQAGTMAELPPATHSPLYLLPDWPNVYLYRDLNNGCYIMR